MSSTSASAASALSLYTIGKRERILQHHYNAATNTWNKCISEIVLEEKPFSEGAFRLALKGAMVWQNSPVEFVCKFAKDITTPKSVYYSDVEAQSVAVLYANKFNSLLPSHVQKIEFVPAFVLEFVDRPGRPVAGCEKYINGTFRKHNNNVGAVVMTSAAAAAANNSSSNSSNTSSNSNNSTNNAGNESEESLTQTQITAQAFSHFTYEESQGNVLICDIQGVDNQFTDPQIHTMNGKGFGMGNLGQTGIRAFLLRHPCNSLCRAVGLPPIHAKNMTEKTLPVFPSGAMSNMSRSSSQAALPLPSTTIDSAPPSLHISSSSALARQPASSSSLTPSASSKRGQSYTFEVLTLDDDNSSSNSSDTNTGAVESNRSSRSSSRLTMPAGSMKIAVTQSESKNAQQQQQYSPPTHTPPHHSQQAHHQAHNNNYHHHHHHHAQNHHANHSSHYHTHNAPNNSQQSSGKNTPNANTTSSSPNGSPRGGRKNYVVSSTNHNTANNNQRSMMVPASFLDDSDEGLMAAILAE